MIFTAIISGIAAVIAFIAGRKKTSSALTKAVSRGLGAVLALVTAATIFFSMFYTQDVGQARVLRDWTGNIVGQDITPGADFKAPWVDTVDFDIRNQIAAYVGDGSVAYSGEAASGPQITVQDKEGVSADLDIVVIYSIRPDAVTDVYSQYLNQENFRARLIEQDIRSIVRNVPAKYNTIEVLTKRAEVAEDIRTALADRWEDKGVIVDSVSLQEVRYSPEVRQNFDSAQQARIAVDRAQAELEKAEVDAQQGIVRATAEAEANRILSASLDDRILQQRYLDTLKSVGEKGNTIIVPEGFNGMVNVR